MVKKYPNGKASSHLHSLEPGQTQFFAFAPPCRGYYWLPNKHSHVYLLAGGAGITPMYQLIQGVLNDPEDRTKITLVHGVNTKDDFVLSEELDGFKTRFPDRFNVVRTVSSVEDDGTAPSSFHKGHITEPLLRQVMKGLAEGSVKVFVCGPPGMEASLLGSNRRCGNGNGMGILGRLGYTKEQIYKF